MASNCHRTYSGHSIECIDVHVCESEKVHIQYVFDERGRSVESFFKKTLHIIQCWGKCQLSVMYNM